MKEVLVRTNYVLSMQVLLSVYENYDPKQFYNKVKNYRLRFDQVLKKQKQFLKKKKK